MPVLSKNLARLPLFLLAIAEAGAVFVSVYLAQAFFLRVTSGSSLSIAPVAPDALFITAVMLLSLIAMGLYEFHQRIGIRQVLTRVMVAIGLGSVVLGTAFLLVPWISIEPRVAGFAVVAVFVSISVIRLGFTRYFDRSMFKRRTIVLGAGARCAPVSKLRRRADRRGFEIVASIPMPGDRERGACEQLLVTDKTLPEIVKQTNANEIVIAMDDRRGALPFKQLLDCKLMGISVIDMLEFLERETGKISLDLIEPGWLILSPGFRTNRLRDFAKRTIDIIGASMAVVLLAPVMAVIAAAIKLNEGLDAPMLYRQRRVGRGGSEFLVLKFRSMRVDAEADGKARWAEVDDDRITPVGHLLRKYRADELPQLFNILRGDMSLVGPRPERPEFIADLCEELPYYANRHSVKPGLTGWAQLKYSYASSTDDTREKLQYDLWYVKNHSMALDLMILIQTAEVVIWGKGAR